MAGRATNEPANYIAFGVQSARDTEATTFTYLKHLDGSGFDEEEDTTAEREGGDGQEVGQIYKTMVKADGQFVNRVRPQSGGKQIAGVLGADSIASAAAGQIHSVVPTSTLPYFTVEQSYADITERNTNVQFTGYDLEFEAGQPVKLTTSFLSGGSVYQATGPQTPTRETTTPFSYVVASAVLSAAGTAFSRITKGKVSVKRNVDDGIQTTGLNRSDVVPLNFDVDADVTIQYEDKVLYQNIKYLGGSQVQLPLASAALDVFIPNTVGSTTFRHVCPNLKAVGAKVNRLDPDGKTMYLDVSLMSVKGATHPVFAKITDAANATQNYLS